MKYDEFRAMDSDIVLAAEGRPDGIEAGFKQVRALVAALEARFTRFSDTSELAQLNRASGRWFRASTELFDMIQQAHNLAQITDGLFDPSILDALEKAGYDKSIDEIRAYGVTRSATPAQPKTFDFRAIQLDPDTRSMRLPRGMRLDLGGIAKGWIAERAAVELAEYSQVCAVSAGGDMFMIGWPAGEAAWYVALEDPRDPAETLAMLRLGPGAVATSCTTKRRWQQGAREQHHLIDPRRGQPAKTEWLSVTAVAPHAAMAEAFAKALLIAGPGQADHIAAQQPGLAFIAVDRAGQIWGSNQARELLDVAVEYA